MKKDLSLYAFGIGVIFGIAMIVMGIRLSTLENTPSMLPLAVTSIHTVMRLQGMQPIISSS